MCRLTTSRINVYLLPSGRIITRRQRYALAGGQRIATGVHPQELAEILRLFVATADKGRMIPEAIGLARDGRTLPLSAHRPMVKIYRERIRRLRRGERIGPAMLEGA